MRWAPVSPRPRGSLPGGPAAPLQPAWLDAGDGARVKARGLHQLAGRHPASGFLSPRAGMDPELDAARAGIARLRLVSHADVAEEPRCQRPVDRPVAFRLVRIDGRIGPAELFQRARKLARYVAPLAHARHGKEVLARLLLHLLVKQPRDFQQRQEIRALVRKGRMALIR